MRTAQHGHMKMGGESAYGGYGLNFLEPDETPESMVRKSSSAFGMVPPSRLPYQCVGKATGFVARFLIPNPQNTRSDCKKQGLPD